MRPLFLKICLVAVQKTNVTPTQELIVLFRTKFFDMKPSKIKVQKSKIQPIPLRPKKWRACKKIRFIYTTANTLAPLALAAMIPALESSKIMQFSGFNPNFSIAML